MLNIETMAAWRYQEIRDLAEHCATVSRLRRVGGHGAPSFTRLAQLIAALPLNRNIPGKGRVVPSPRFIGRDR